ncbi:LysR substrate-binding domain-containing protein [Actinoplanes sp. N902-109]|uniref:LysR substrate-binding domain-containing protein n=1 Tax=Actinoplanes sp. (strain N902-109) TaxID=649831 RepID=UPI000329658C|nr:LysR substrate-binding domain-containing protein [Actinoplanes sp. N902-109]AGL16865.1 hypothetical protein L083_3355 [Actinoplanes sp. N902-109]
MELRALLDSVRDRRVDLAIVSWPTPWPVRTAVTGLAHGGILVACPAGHPFVTRKAVTCRDVVAEPLVTAGQPGSRGSDYVQRPLACAGQVATVPHQVQGAVTPPAPSSAAAALLGMLSLSEEVSPVPVAGGTAVPRPAPGCSCGFPAMDGR